MLNIHFFNFSKIESENPNESLILIDTPFKVIQFETTKKGVVIKTSLKLNSEPSTTKISLDSKLREVFLRLFALCVWTASEIGS